MVLTLAHPRIERDRGDPELVENGREDRRRVAVVVVDQHAEPGVADAVRVHRFEDVIDVAGNRLAVLNVAHLVESRAAEVLAKEQVLELALGALVDLQAVGVEEPDVGAALIQR